MVIHLKLAQPDLPAARALPEHRVQPVLQELMVQPDQQAKTAQRELQGQLVIPDQQVCRVILDHQERKARPASQGSQARQEIAALRENPERLVYRARQGKQARQDQPEFRVKPEAQAKWVQLELLVLLVQLENPELREKQAARELSV